MTQTPGNLRKYGVSDYAVTAHGGDFTRAPRQDALTRIPGPGRMNGMTFG